MKKRLITDDSFGSDYALLRGTDTRGSLALDPWSGCRVRWRKATLT